MKSILLFEDYQNKCSECDHMCSECTCPDCKCPKCQESKYKKDHPVKENIEEADFMISFLGEAEIAVDEFINWWSKYIDDKSKKTGENRDNLTKEVRKLCMEKLLKWH